MAMLPDTTFRFGPDGVYRFLLVAASTRIRIHYLPERWSMVILEPATLHKVCPKKLSIMAQPPDRCSTYRISATGKRFYPSGGAVHFACPSEE